jgi:hypothetical protein
MSTKSVLSLYTPAELRKLYQENPALFDQLAQEAIKNACSARTPEQSLKLQQLQWTIDMQLRKAKTPLARMHAMEHIFYGKIYGEDGQLSKLVSTCKKLVQAVTGGTVEAGGGKEPGKLKDVG